MDNKTRDSEDRATDKGLVSKQSQIYFYGLSMLTSFLNFLYYPLLSRLLPVNVYGEVQFLITILFQISVLFLALNIISILFALRYSHDGALLSRKTAALASILNISTLLITALLVAVLSIFHEGFQFDSTLPILALGLAIVSTVPFTIGIGKLQGQNLYTHSGIMNATGAALKLICSAILVVLGLGATGAILGVAIGQIFAVVIFRYRKLLSLRELLSVNARAVSILKSDIILLTTSVSAILINIILTADTIGAKIILSPVEAGQYAGIATLAKIAIFVVSPIMWLVIPSATNFSTQSKITRKQVGIAVLFCIALMVAYLFAGDLLISLVVGDKYLVMKDLLLFSTAAASALAIAAMLNVILIARRKYIHTAVQTLLILLSFTSIVALGNQYIPSVETILLAQVISGGLGVLYYTIVSGVINEK